MKRSALIILGLIALSITAKAQDEKFKALFMYNFTKYIEWPQNKQSGDFVIGVIGNPAIVGELNAIAQRKTVGSQAIKISMLKNLTICDYDYI
ncbi:MAG: YfiR family protein [Salinivirgaceae bacterium]|nr:YfiR family protein [Salinivirgaceae bacterium]